MRRYLYLTHLWIGLILGAYFSFMGLTGSSLVFKTEVHEAFTPSLYKVQVPSTPTRISLDTLIRGFTKGHSDVDSFSVMLPLEPDSSTIIRYIPANPPGWHGQTINPFSPVSPPASQGRHDRRELFIDPYTGKFLGEQLVGGTFFYVVHNLHAHLLLEGFGYTIHTYGALVLFGLVVSGLWLWWPSLKNFRKQFRARTRIKFGASIKRVLVDIHHAVGFYVFVVLLIIVTTASLHFWPAQATSIFSIAERIFPNPDLAIRSNRVDPSVNTGCSLSGQKFRRIDYDELVHTAARIDPSLSVLELDLGRTNPVVILGSRNAHGVAPLLTSVTVDACSGRVRYVQTPDTTSMDVKATNWIMFVHFGQWGPEHLYYVVKAIWFAAGLCPALLFVSGVMMYLNKRKARRLVRERRASACQSAP